MKIIGIIAEYNPFHNGHLYQFDKLRSLCGADTEIVVIMSGDFVQRGQPAIVDKYARTAAALSSGAAAVIELPVAFATQSAEGFARAGVGMAVSLGLDGISYGCEAGDDEQSLIKEIASILAEEPFAYKRYLREHLKEGMNFPAARMDALREYLGVCGWNDEKTSKVEIIMSSPNNILAIEYEKAVIKAKNDGLAESFDTYPIRRKGDGYHETGSAIREALCKDGAGLNKLMPDAMIENLSYHIELDDFSNLLFYKLLSLNREELASYQDMNDELAARVLKCLDRAKKISELVNLASTKNYTLTRIQRALLHVLLDIKEDAGDIPKIARILGLLKDSCALKSLKKSSKIELVTKLADAPNDAWNIDERASAIYNQVVEGKFGIALPDEYHAGPVIK